MDCISATIKFVPRLMLIEMSDELLGPHLAVRVLLRQSSRIECRCLLPDARGGFMSCAGGLDDRTLCECGQLGHKLVIRAYWQASRDRAEIRRKQAYGGLLVAKSSGKDVWTGVTCSNCDMLEMRWIALCGSALGRIGLESQSGGPLIRSAPFWSASAVNAAPGHGAHLCVSDEEHDAGRVRQ